MAVKELVDYYGSYDRIETSAGGLVYFQQNDEIWIVLLKRADGTWTLPKGHIHEHETAAETSLREIEEETGLPQKMLVLGRSLGWYPNPIRATKNKGEKIEITANIYKLVKYYVVHWTGNHMPPLKATEHAGAAWIRLGAHREREFAYSHVMHVIADGVEWIAENGKRKKLGTRN